MIIGSELTAERRWNGHGNQGSSSSRTSPGLGQVYALEARKHITTFRQREPAMVAGLRWCPAHKVLRNEKADGWAKLATDVLDTQGVESLGYGDRYGRGRFPPAPVPSAKRRMRGRTLKSPGAAGRRDRGKTSSWLRDKRLASRYYQLKTGHCLTGQYLHWMKSRPTARFWW